MKPSYTSSPARGGEEKRGKRTAPSADELMIRAFSKLDKTALGLAFGTLVGLLVFLATIILLVKGGRVVGPNLALLGQYFIGYSVTLTGSLVGLGYGIVTGFVVGWLTAFFYNLAVTIYLYLIKLKANLSAIPDVIDPDHRS